MKTFLNLTKSEWKEFGKDALVRVAIGLPAAFLIASLGSSVGASWAVIPVTPLVTGGAGWLISRKKERKERASTTIGFAVLGLLFGVIGFLTN